MARRYLEFREKNEKALEIVDAALAGIVFVLLFSDREHASHLVGITSHVLVGFLFLTKLLSVIAVKLRNRWFTRNAVS